MYFFNGIVSLTTGDGDAGFSTLVSRPHHINLPFLRSGRVGTGYNVRPLSLLRRHQKPSSVKDIPLGLKETQRSRFIRENVCSPKVKPSGTIVPKRDNATAARRYLCFFY